MDYQITRTVTKSVGRSEYVRHTCLIDGVVYSDYHIFRKIFGITYETNSGLFEPSGTVRLFIGDNFKEFSFPVMNDSNFSVELGRRVYLVSEWLSTLTYSNLLTAVISV